MNRFLRVIPVVLIVIQATLLNFCFFTSAMAAADKGPPFEEILAQIEALRAEMNSRFDELESADDQQDDSSAFLLDQLNRHDLEVQDRLNVMANATSYSATFCMDIGQIGIGLDLGVQTKGGAGWDLGPTGTFVMQGGASLHGGIEATTTYCVDVPILSVPDSSMPALSADIQQAGIFLEDVALEIGPRLPLVLGGELGAYLTSGIDFSDPLGSPSGFASQLEVAAKGPGGNIDYYTQGKGSFTKASIPYLNVLPLAIDIEQEVIGFINTADPCLESGVLNSVLGGDIGFVCSGEVLEVFDWFDNVSPAMEGMVNDVGWLVEKFNQLEPFWMAAYSNSLQIYYWVRDVFNWIEDIWNYIF